MNDRRFLLDRCSFGYVKGCDYDFGSSMFHQTLLSVRLYDTFFVSLLPVLPGVDGTRPVPLNARAALPVCCISVKKSQIPRTSCHYGQAEA